MNTEYKIVFYNKDFYHKHRDYIAKEYEVLGIEKFKEKYPYLDSVLSQHDDRFMIVAWSRNGDMIGFSSLSNYSIKNLSKETQDKLNKHSYDDTYLAVNSISVVPQYRNKGFARKLLEATFEFSLKHARDNNDKISHLKLSSFSETGIERMPNLVKKVAKQYPNLLVEYGSSDISKFGLYVYEISIKNDLLEQDIVQHIPILNL